MFLASSYLQIETAFSKRSTNAALVFGLYDIEILGSRMIHAPRLETLEESLVTIYLLT